MSIVSHLIELESRHRVLDRSIDEEMSRPFVDTMRIATLKKKKLHLKEEIERLKAQNHLH
ncbi:MAG: YdcH family protein [Flavobacteriaceae bacterium]